MRSDVQVRLFCRNDSTRQLLAQMSRPPFLSRGQYWRNESQVRRWMYFRKEWRGIDRWRASSEIATNRATSNAKSSRRQLAEAMRGVVRDSTQKLAPKNDRRGVLRDEGDSTVDWISSSPKHKALPPLVRLCVFQGTARIETRSNTQSFPCFMRAAQGG